MDAGLLGPLFQDQEAFERDVHGVDDPALPGEQQRMPPKSRSDVKRPAGTQPRRPLRKQWGRIRVVTPIPQ